MDQFFGTDQVNIYNLDLSIYRTLTLPTPPAGYTWPSPNYVTEALFDTDPTTIEYMLTGYCDTPGQFIFGIYREDGSALFTKTPGMALSGGGASDFDSWPPIFQTPEGPKLLLQAGFSAPTELYSLPGEVPCISACFPVAEENFSVNVDDLNGTQGSLSVESSAAGVAMVRYALPNGVMNGLLSVVDVQERICSVVPLDGSGRYSLDTAHLAAGSYMLHVQTRQGALPTASMNVIR